MFCIQEKCTWTGYKINQYLFRQLDDFYAKWVSFWKNGKTEREMYCFKLFLLRSDLEECHWILKQPASDFSTASILTVFLPSSLVYSSWWKTFGGEEMWPLHHSTVCPYSIPSSTYFSSSKKPSNNKWFSISCLTRSLCHQRQGVRNLAQGTVFPKRPNNKLADPHRAEWHIFPSLWRSVYRVLRIQLCIWNNLYTVCSKSVAGNYTGAAAGVSIGLFIIFSNNSKPDSYIVIGFWTLRFRCLSFFSYALNI